jgi:hypothetical protein
MELLTISGLILGFGLGIKLYTFYINKKRKELKEAMDKSPVPVFFPVDESTTCSAKNEPHQWESLNLMDVGSRSSTERLVCLKCGVINGIDRQFSQAGLENIKRQQKALEEAKAFAKELEDFRETELNRLARDNREEFREQIFKAGYKAFLEIEQMVEEKIMARKRKLFEEALSKIEGLKKD